MISKKIKDFDAIGVNYNEIGLIYIEQNNLEPAKIFLDQALEAFLKLGSKSRQAECHLYLGQYFVKANNPEEAILHFKTALNLAKETGSKEFYSNALLKLSEVYEITVETKNKLYFFAEEPPVSLLFLKKNNSLYFFLLTINNNAENLDPNLLYSLIKQ